MKKCRYFIPALVLLVVPGIELRAQENVYGTGQDRISFLGSPIEAGDSIFFNLATCTSPQHPKGAFQEYASYFMSFDQNGVLGSMVLHPDTNLQDADSVYLYKMGYGINPDIAFFSYLQARPFEPERKVTTFGVYDIPGRYIKQQVPLDTAGKLWHHNVTSFVQDSSHLILGGTVVVDPFSTSKPEKFYSIYDNNYNLLHTKVDTGSYGGTYNGVQVVGDKYFIFHRDPPWEEFEVLNADLSVDTILKRSSIYPVPARNYQRSDFSAIPNPFGQGFYVLSYYRNGNYAVLKFNDDYSVASVDSFPAKEAGYDYAFPWKKPFDWNQPDTIYGIVGLWEGPGLNTWSGMDRVGRSEPFKVLQFDTTGTVHWSRIIGRDSAVYFPYQLVATKDGGVLVFSFLYDSQYSNSIHSRLSVIKVGADGSVLHQNEYEMPVSSELVLYPNPVQHELNIELPEEYIGPGDYHIFSMKGGSWIRGRFKPEKSIKVEQLQPGSYILHLQLDNGLVQTGRFVKE